jgi:anaerobic magnesium-protoporphyrin IX monomethyl ester cyclase
MKVTLVRSSFSPNYTIYKTTPRNREIRVPLGLLYLAAVLEKEGHEVKIIDGEPELLTHNQVIDRIKEQNPDLLGISSTTPEFHITKDIISHIKHRNPKIITVVGGAHVSALPQESLDECPEIDYVVVGEGERSIMRIVNERPKERIIQSPLIENLDDLPPPARHLINYKNYRYPVRTKGLMRMDTIESTRGCPFNCLFCFHTYGKKVRYRDPIKVIDELEWSYHNTGARLFFFFDDTFSAKKERAILMCDEIIRRKLKVECFCLTRVDCLDFDILKKMKQAGFNQITCGIESGNQNILNILRKGTTLEQYEKAYGWMDKLRMETRGSFILGSPYETAETIEDSIRFAKKLPLYRIGVNIMTPYPGSPVHEYCKEGKGIRFASHDWRDFKRWGNAAVETDALSKEDLERYQKKFLREFNGSWKVVKYHLKKLFMGNFSIFYYRPVVYAVTQRIKYALGRGNG